MNFFLGNIALIHNGIYCKKCRRYEGEIESHHVWPKYMDNPHGYTWKEGLPNRYYLCFDCHKKLHQEIIIPLLNKLIGTSKYNGSEHHLWKKVKQKDKPFIIEETISVTIKFVEGDNGLLY